MNYNPLEDGITHLNLYSKGETEIGRLLSNFAYCPIVTADGKFNSIEGYWGWLGTSEDNPRREEFRNVWGYKAKQLKTDLFKSGDKGRFDPDFKNKIKAAIHIKFQTDKVQNALRANMDLIRLPICHYYYFGDKNNSPKIVDCSNRFPEFIESVREEIKEFLARN